MGYALENNHQGISYVVSQTNERCQKSSQISHLAGKALNECYEVCLTDPSCVYFAHWPSGQPDSGSILGSGTTDNDCRTYKAPCEPYHHLKEGFHNSIYMILQA